MNITESKIILFELHTYFRYEIKNSYKINFRVN